MQVKLPGLKAHGLAGILATTVLLTSHISAASSCDLNGKTISVHYDTCPRDAVGIDAPLPESAGRCWETRTRFAVVGKKVAHYEDEITPEGVVFYIGDRVEVTTDKDQTRFLFGQDFPQLYQRAWVTGSYTAGELRLQTEVDGYFKDDNSQFSTTTNSWVFEIANDCSACSLASTVNALRIDNKRNGKTSLLTRVLDKQLSCEIRNGI